MNGKRNTVTATGSPLFGDKTGPSASVAKARPGAALAVLQDAACDPRPSGEPSEPERRAEAKDEDTEEL